MPTHVHFFKFFVERAFEQVVEIIGRVWGGVSAADLLHLFAFLVYEVSIQKIAGGIRKRMPAANALPAFSQCGGA
jgi:hypothetical protein